MPPPSLRLFVAVAEVGDLEKPALQRQEAAGWDLSLVLPERMINHDERGVNSCCRQKHDCLDPFADATPPFMAALMEALSAARLGREATL